jgi:hypothetical protein
MNEFYNIICGLLHKTGADKIIKNDKNRRIDSCGTLDRSEIPYAAHKSGIPYLQQPDNDRMSIVNDIMHTFNFIYIIPQQYNYLLCAIKTLLYRWKTQSKRIQFLSYSAEHSLLG